MLSYWSIRYEGLKKYFFKTWNWYVGKQWKITKLEYKRQGLAINLNISNNDLLNYAISQGIINMDDVRDSMIQKEQERLLSKHKYKIFQGKDKRWRTTLPDNSKKSGRRMVVKTKYEDLKKAIIDFYASEEDDNYEKEHLDTIRKI